MLLRMANNQSNLHRTNSFVQPSFLRFGTPKISQLQSIFILGCFCWIILYLHPFKPSYIYQHHRQISDPTRIARWWNLGKHEGTFPYLYALFWWNLGALPMSPWLCFNCCPINSHHIYVVACSDKHNTLIVPALPCLLPIL